MNKYSIKVDKKLIVKLKPFWKEMRTLEGEFYDQIQKIEKEYYEGFSCPEETLKNWIQNLHENFIVAQANNKIVGFIFFEYLTEIRALPFVHELKHNPDGKYVYISEIGFLDKFQDSDIPQKLFNKLIGKSKKDGCKMLVWLTGSKSKHDKTESGILLDNHFTKKQNVKHWEAYHNYFVDDHYIWTKEI